MKRSAHSEANNGLNVTEARVMALWDDGHSIEQIAKIIERARHQVGLIVATFDVNGPDDRLREAATRAASIRYAAALAATGRRYA